LENCSDAIGASNYELNSQSIECCNVILRILVPNVDNNLINNILGKTKVMLSEGKIPKFFDVLIDHYPNCIQNYSELIVKSGESEYNFKLIEKKIISVEKCIHILKTIANAENIHKLGLFYSKVNQNVNSLFAEVN
jgi:hypothetical protein